MIISIDAEKAFDKIQHQFMIKTLNKVHIKYLNIIKAVYDKPTPNITLKSKKLKAIPKKIRNKTRMPLSPLLFNTVLEVPVRAKGRKKEIKLLPLKFVGDMIFYIYIKNPKDAIKILLEIINEYNIVARYKIDTQKSVAFLYANNELAEREIKKTIPFTIATKRIKYLGINLSKEAKELYTENYKTLLK